jgi:DNA transposition AAA+ family ATPase
MTNLQAQALAKALRTIRNIAAKALKENDLPQARGRDDHFSAKEKATILDLDLQGVSATKIARKIGVSQPGVSAFLRKAANQRILREQMSEANK